MKHYNIMIFGIYNVFTYWNIFWSRPSGKFIFRRECTGLYLVFRSSCIWIIFTSNLLYICVWCFYTVQIPFNSHWSTLMCIIHVYTHIRDTQKYCKQYCGVRTGRTFTCQLWWCVCISVWAKDDEWRVSFLAKDLWYTCNVLHNSRRYSMTTIGRKTE